MLNKVILMGRLTRDPEAKATSSGVSMTTFALAVDRSYARQGEEKQTDFINIIAFRSTADFVQRYFSKGQLVAVTGRLQVRTWDDNEGKKRYATEVVADEVFFAESKRDSAGGGNYGNDYNPAQYQNKPANPPQQTAGPEGFMSVADDDDLPF